MLCSLKQLIHEYVVIPPHRVLAFRKGSRDSVWIALVTVRSIGLEMIWG